MTGSSGVLAVEDGDADGSSSNEQDEQRKGGADEGRQQLELAQPQAPPTAPAERTAERERRQGREPQFD